VSKKYLLDDLISVISPSVALRRTKARFAIDMMRKYEANSKGRRTAGWLTTGSGSANAEVGNALALVRERVRDLVRNNPYAGSALNVIEGNVIGTGIMSTVTGKSGRAADKLSQAWLEWCESIDADSDGVNNFYGLQALVMRSIAESGECLVIRKWRNPNDGYSIPVPFQIEIAEGDLIDTFQSRTLDNGGFILQGVEFNAKKKRVAYWLWNQHPGEMILSNKGGIKSERVDAKDILHLYRVDRAGQVRGISWGAPCVIKMRDYDEYTDAQLLRQKIASMFALFIKDSQAPEDSVAAEDNFNIKLEAGAVEFLPPGKDIVFPTLPAVSNDGHSERVLRAIAKGWGVTYEAMTGDLSNVNFSSGRMGHLEFQRNVRKWQWNLFIPRFCNPVFKWFLEAASVQGLQTEGARAVWTPPRIEMINPAQEIGAIVSGVRAGLQSLPDAIREQGYDLDTHLNEIKSSNDKLDELGIILDSDPRKVMKSGIMQAPTSTELSQPFQPDPAPVAGQ